MPRLLWVSITLPGNSCPSYSPLQRLARTFRPPGWARLTPTPIPTGRGRGVCQSPSYCPSPHLPSVMGEQNEFHHQNSSCSGWTVSLFASVLPPRLPRGGGHLAGSTRRPRGPGRRASVRAFGRQGHTGRMDLRPLPQDCAQSQNVLGRSCLRESTPLCDRDVPWSAPIPASPRVSRDGGPGAWGCPTAPSGDSGSCPVRLGGGSSCTSARGLRTSTSLGLQRVSRRPPSVPRDRDDAW